MQDHPATAHPDLMVGIGAGDDASVYALEDGRALLQTVDIFTPVVDSPTDWGRIAAANALSDIYAMGGRPLTALQYLAWPRDELSFDLATEVISGGMDVMGQGGCTVVGGHTIDGPEPTYGFAVTGVVDADHVVTNAGGKPGDTLVLTKPLGMGIITTAIKHGTCPNSLAEQAIAVMVALNDVAGAALSLYNATAATDITGYGLIGHLREMCQASDVGAEIVFDAVPILDGAAELLAQEMWAGGSQRNLAFLEPNIETKLDVDHVKLLVDAQTSGGLLVALPPKQADSYVTAVPGSARIGHLTDEKTIRLI